MAEKTEDQEAVLKKITDKGNEFLPVFQRMDVDKALLFMDSYEMMRPDLKGTPMDNVVNVTLNDPSTFTMRAIATLGATQRQAQVKGRDMKEKACSIIESFIDDITYSVDEYLILREILSLDAFLNEQICVRGRIVARVALHKKDSVLVPNVMPLDSRFFVYDMGVNGMNWGAAISYRSKNDVYDEYGYESEEDKPEVIDFYDHKNNLIFIDQGKEVKQQENPYGEPPFVVALSPAGSMLSDEDAYQHKGEGVLWQNRKLFPELNRLASIFQTLNVGSFAGAVQYESTLGTRAKKPKKPPWGIWSATPVEKGGGYKPMPANDIRMAARLFYAILYTRIQQGGLSAIDYGNLTFPLSAVAITRLTSSRDQIFLPRIQAKALFYRQLYRMIIKQFKHWGITTKLGEAGFINEYEPKQLDGEYQIKFRFFTESKEQEIANLSVANAARGLMSQRTIRRDILKIQEPEKEEEYLAEEETEMADRAVFLYNRCSKLIAQGKNIAAWMAYSALRDVLRQRKMASLMASAQAGVGAGAGEEKPKPLPQGDQIIPLLGQGPAGATVAPEVGKEEEEMNKAEALGEKEAGQGSKATQEVVK